MAGKIFINYRRDDSIAAAGRIYDSLKASFGGENLFLDVDNIPASADFAEHIEGKLAECDLVLALIGRSWLEARERGWWPWRNRRRIDNPADWVRVEIALAIKRGIPIIPVLIDGTPMPRDADLPANLRPLTRRNAVELRNVQFATDVQRLEAKIKEALAAHAARPIEPKVSPPSPVQASRRPLIAVWVGLLALGAVGTGLWQATTVVKGPPLGQSTREASGKVGATAPALPPPIQPLGASTDKSALDPSATATATATLPVSAATGSPTPVPPAPAAVPTASVGSPPIPDPKPDAARQKVIEAFDKVLAGGKSAAVLAFLAEHPGSPEAAEADRAYADFLRFERAEALNTADAYEAYVRDVAGARRADEAKKRAAERRQAEVEKQCRELASEAVSALGEMGKLGCEPRGDHWLPGEAVHLSRCLRSAAETRSGEKTKRSAELEACRKTAKQKEAWRKAVSAGTPDAIVAFRKSWPGSSLDGEARQKLDVLETDEWKKTEKSGTEDAYRAFKQKFPDSRRNNEADRRIAALAEAVLTKACDAYAAAALIRVKESAADNCSLSGDGERWSPDAARHVAFCRSSNDATRQTEAAARDAAVRSCTRPRRDSEAWEAAKLANTSEAMADYLADREWFRSSNRPLAEARLAELCEAEWPAARKANTWGSLRPYGRAHCAKGPRATEAKRLMAALDDAAWSKASAAKTKAAYLAYRKATGGSDDDDWLGGTGEGEHSEAATAAIADIDACENARKLTDGSDIKSFLDQNKKSRCFGEIEAKYDKLTAEARRKEEADWEAAKDADTIAAYEAYLRTYSDLFSDRQAAFEKQARDKIAELKAWENATFSWTIPNIKALAADASNTRDRRVAVVYQNGLLALFDANSGRIVDSEKISKGDGLTVDSLAFSPDGKRLAVTTTTSRPDTDSDIAPGWRIGGQPTSSTTRLLNGITGSELKSWSATKSNGFSDDGKILRLSPTKEDEPEFEWDVQANRKVVVDTPDPRVRARRLMNESVGLPTEAPADSPDPLSVSIDQDGDVSLASGSTTAFGTLPSAGGLPASFVMLDGGEPFVTAASKQFTGSSAAVAATRIDLDGKLVALPAAFKRRFHKPSGLKLLDRSPSTPSSE